MARELPKRHLFDVREHRLFDRHRTRCGKVPKSDGDPGNRVIIGDWSRVDLVPSEGQEYCVFCHRGYQRDDGVGEVARSGLTKVP